MGKKVWRPTIRGGEHKKQTTFSGKEKRGEQTKCDTEGWIVPNMKKTSKSTSNKAREPSPNKIVNGSGFGLLSGIEEDIEKVLTSSKTTSNGSTTGSDLEQSKEEPRENESLRGSDNVQVACPEKGSVNGDEDTKSTCTTVRKDSIADKGLISNDGASVQVPTTRKSERARELI
ncbi:hypothetical protein GIB67_022545 [Kingdonia uniflora]|uniref:Uncharacterized protein n=1 Tax=Kingdonia uniflora TaxID=39325 RepID=A0A7J7L7A7_9MAGN|nr:hypothetical protein GIB67_022545 [Kingdonia uniflora]